MDASNRVVLTMVLCASAVRVAAQAPPLLLECGVTQDVTTVAVGQTVDYPFVGTAGTLVRFEVDKLGTGFKWNPKLNIYDPSGQFVVKVDPADELVLLSSGVYTIELFDGLSNGYGTARLRWQAITPAACTELMNCGEVVEGAIPSKDFRNVHSFHGDAGDLVSLRLEKLNKAEGLWSPIVRVHNPNGFVFLQFLPHERDKQAFTLPMSGDYTVTVGDVGTDGWGAYRLALDWIWPGEKACAPELFCGDKSSGATTHAGARDIRRFEGEAGDIVHFDVMREPALFFTPVVELYKPNSSVHFEQVQGSKDVVLPSTGTYTVVLHDDSWDAHGTWRLELEWLFPTEKSCAPWLADCAPQGGQILGQDDIEYYRLDGTAGESVALDLIKGPGKVLWAPKALLLDPWTDVLPAPPAGGSYVLPATGTYTVAVKDQAVDSQGCFQVRVRRNGEVCPSPATPGCGGKALEFIDMAAPEYSVLPMNASILAAGGRELVGLAADGVTPVLIRASDLPGPGMITFRVADDSDSVSADSVGSLADPLSGATGNPLTVPLQFDAATGEWFGAAELTSPLNFARGPHDFEAGARELTVVATGSAGGCATGALTLLRPPALLVHGIWGARETWRWPTLMHEGATEMSVKAKSLPPWVQVHDYVLTHADPMLDNVEHLQQGIDSALRRFRGLDPAEHAFIAATQVDLVAHSYGGVVARLYCSDMNGRYFRAENRLLGDVHKLVTLGGAHWGSPWADLVVPVLQIPLLGDTFAFLAEQASFCLDCGGVSDLRVSHLDTVPAATVPIHAVYGTGGTDLVTSGGLQETTFDDEVGVFLNAFAWLHGLTLLDATQLVFGSKPHDMLVDVDSQRGGLSGPRTTLVTGVHGMHTFMQKSWQVEAITARMLSERLDASDPASAFAPFIPPGPEVADFSPPYGALAAASLALPPIPDFVPFGVEMVPWFPSTTGLGTGDVLPVEVRGVGGFQPTEVFVIAGGRAYRKQTSPFLVLVEMPADTVGLVPIYALAYGAGNNVTVSADLLVTINPTPGLDKLYALPAPVFLTYDSPTVQLGVRALYTDGSGRLVDPEDDGLHFTVVPGGVASVDGEGRLSALAPGVASVIVGYAGKTVTIPVFVVTHEGDDGTHAVALRRELAGNVGSLKLSGSKGGRPVLGSTLSLRLDLSTTGHAAGAIVLRPDPLFYPAPGGQAVGIDLFSLPSIGFPIVPGADTVTVTVPATTILIGRRLYAQGIHFGSAPASAPIVAFSNTWDLRLGLE